MNDHPHLLRVYRDKIGKFRYLRSILTGRNFQVDQAFILEKGQRIKMPGDWVITIKKYLVIVTCDGFVFSRRTPIVVKPWKPVGRVDLGLLNLVLGDSIGFEDCDGLEWDLHTPGENSDDGETRKSLTAEDKEGEESLVFYLKDKA